MPEASSGNGKVALHYGDGSELDLPVKTATEGSAGIEVTKLLATTGMVTLDPGFVNTAACSSEITYIDGDAGILRYRGYPIEQLAEKSTFLEVSYLLIYGELPTADAAGGLHREGHPPHPARRGLQDVLQRLPARRAPDGGAVVGRVRAVELLPGTPRPAQRGGRRPLHDPAAGQAADARPRTSTSGRSASRYLYPDNSLTLVENFLRLTFGIPAEEYQVDPEVAKALDMLFVLHADHEQNCSTSTVRVVGSSEANVFASISAGVHALSGPLHGGANAAVLDMLEDIRDQGGDVNAYVTRVKNKEPGVKLMGFGHRVYKNYDPRARIVKAAADQLLTKLAPNDHLLDLATQLEEVALKDDYFISRKLYPNVDFYTGLIYRAMGFPTDMFTVLFAIGRLPGWLAHYKEMLHDPATKIARPRQVYTGPAERDFLEMEKR